MKNYLFIILVVIISCTPKGIAKRTYKKVDQIAPYTTLDSSRLAKRSASTFPPKPVVVKTGTVKPDVKKDSTKFYKTKLAEALAGKDISIQQLQDKYKDSLKEYQQAAVDGYEVGYNFAYKVGLFDGKSQCPIPVICEPDTIYSETPEQAAIRERDRLNAAVKDREAIEWKAKASVYKDDASYWRKCAIITWIALGLIIVGWIVYKIYFGKLKIPKVNA